MKNTTIDINGIKLDNEAQIKLTGIIKNYVYGLKQIKSEQENLKDILEVVKDELKIKPAYVKRAAQELFKEELGKLNRSEKNDDDAAVEQCREIYCERETGIGAHYADEPDDDTIENSITI